MVPNLGYREGMEQLKIQCTAAEVAVIVWDLVETCKKSS